MEMRGKEEICTEEINGKSERYKGREVWKEDIERVEKTQRSKRMR